MAVAITMDSSLPDYLRLLANQLGLDELRLVRDANRIGHTLSGRIGQRMVNMTITDFDGANRYDTLDELAARIARELKKRSLDIRLNAIESLDDVMALLSKAKEHMQQPEELIITPEQAALIDKLAEQVSSRPPGSRCVTLYGCKLNIQEAPAWT